jgi:hypothetical protein
VIDDSRGGSRHFVSTPRYVTVGSHQNQRALIDVPHTGLIQSDHTERQANSLRR